MSPRSLSGPEITKLGGGATPGWLTRDSVAVVRPLEALPFAPEEYAARRRRALDRLAGMGVEAVFVFKPSSVEYLCAHHSSAMAPQPLLLTPEGTHLYVPESEAGRALASSCADTVLLYGGPGNPLEAMARHVAGLLPSGSTVAVEVGQTSVPPRIVDALGANGLRVVDGDHVIERTRMVLSPAEIECVEGAAVVTQRGVEMAVEAAREPGATDSSVAAAIGAALFEDATSPPPRGAPIVATGPRGGVPHSTFCLTPLRDGETTFLEFTGAYYRYCAPVMRTLARGKLSQIASRLEDLSRATIQAVLETIKPGVACSEVARAAEGAIGTLEEEIIFHHNYGYPVGLGHAPTWMDGAPFELVESNHGLLEAGMVFHLPASFRWFGVAAVGLSQTFVVEEGGARVLTHGPAEVIRL